jgi:hypothetical protein
VVDYGIEAEIVAEDTVEGVLRGLERIVVDIEVGIALVAARTEVFDTEWLV